MANTDKAQMKTQMIQVKDVKPLENFKLWVSFQDETEGTIDLSDLAQKPVFQFWQKDNNFQKVYVDHETGAIAWTDDIQISSDTIYFEINNIDPEEYFASLKTPNAQNQ